MKISICFVFIAFSNFSQESERDSIVIDSVMNRMSIDLGNMNSMIELGICNCIDSELGKKSQFGKESTSFDQTFSQMYNQFYPLARFLDKDSLRLLLTGYVLRTKFDAEKKLQSIDEKFRLTNSISFSCFQIFERSEMLETEFKLFLIKPENYNNYVLADSRYFVKYLEGIRYRY